MAKASYIETDVHEDPALSAIMSTKEAKSWWNYQMRHNSDQQT